MENIKLYEVGKSELKNLWHGGVVAHQYINSNFICACGGIGRRVRNWLTFIKIFVIIFIDL